MLTSRNTSLPVLFYSMAASGAAPFARALETLGFERVHQVQSMDDDWRAYSKSPTPATGMNAAQKERYDFENEIKASVVNGGEECLIVSFAPEPLTRNLRAFCIGQARRLKGDEDAAALHRGMLSQYPHSVPLEWYQREFNKTLGLDVFDYAFEPQDGYRLIEHGRFKILILRTELDNIDKSEILSDFLSVKVNVADDNRVGLHDLSVSARHLYQRFRSEVRFRKEFLDFLYQSDYVRHFMDEEETERFRDRWQFVGAPAIAWRTAF